MNEQDELLAAPSDQVGLDDLITVNGEYTTIRKEHRVGYATSMRVDDHPVTGQATHSYWALIEGHSFPVSAEDHAFLRSDGHVVAHVVRPT